MRTIVIVASAAACLGLAACGQSKSEATAAAAPAPKKYTSRSATFYAGQEQILAVNSASVEPSKSGALTLKVEGMTPSAGYHRFGYVPRINAVAPPDGIYDVDVVGYRPDAASPPAETPVTVSADWSSAPMDRVKGVRFITKTNDVVAMLPAG